MKWSGIYKSRRQASQEKEEEGCRYTKIKSRNWLWGSNKIYQTLHEVFFKEKLANDSIISNKNKYVSKNKTQAKQSGN